MDKNEVPAKSRNKVLSLCGGVLVAVFLLCTLCMAFNFFLIKHKLKNQPLIYTVEKAERSQATLLEFCDGNVCRIHTYYYLDDLHFQQETTYQLAKIKLSDATVRIDGQTYSASMQDKKITLTDREGNLYASGDSEDVQTLIDMFVSDIQSQRGKKLMADTEQLEVNREQQEKEQAEREQMQENAAEQQKQESLAENKQKALNEFLSLSSWDGYSMNDMIKFIFVTYPTITCEPEGNSQTRFLITVTGKYYPNKADVLEYKLDGTMVVAYDIQTGTCEIREGKSIYDAMNLYYLLGLDGAQKEAEKKLYGY